MNHLSVVINTRNEEENLPQAIQSIKNIADEIVVVDMESTDKTVEIAKKLGAKVFNHKYLGYVEPTRNFAILKATSDWVFVLDADEEINSNLGKKIKNVLKSPDADYYRIPRKNIIFGHWMKHARWWPDYNIRLFKKGSVSWNEIIHSVPMTQGIGKEFEAKEEFAIIHHNYNSIDDYLLKMSRYSKIQSENLIKNGYIFEWSDIVKKPLGEFLSRFFAGQGYKDGVHGLALSLLQAFSELILYIRLWEKVDYKEKDLNTGEIKSLFEKSMNDVKWWIRKEFSWIKVFQQ